MPERRNAPDREARGAAGNRGVLGTIVAEPSDPQRLAAALFALESMPASLWRVLRTTVKPANLSRARYAELLRDGDLDLDVHQANVERAKFLLWLADDDDGLVRRFLRDRRRRGGRR